MPFSKHVIRPEHIEAMRLAFQKVCEALELECKPGEPMTELVVTKIIEHAKAGEIDPERLCRQVLLEISSTKKYRPMKRQTAEDRFAISLGQVGLVRLYRIGDR